MAGGAEVMVMYKDKRAVTYRLSVEAREKLRECAEVSGTSVTEVVERMVRGELAGVRAVPLLVDVLALEPEVRLVYESDSRFRQLVQRLWRHV